MVRSIEQDILQKTKSLWDIQGNPEFIRHVQNSVYKISLSGKPAILRLTNADHRNANEIQQELEWASFLSSNGCNVAHPIFSVNGNFVEKIELEESVWFSSIFSFAMGKSIDEALCPKTLYEWGRELGKVHYLAMHYKPNYVRNDYKSINKYFLDPTSYISSSRRLSETIDKINKWLTSLPKDKTNYGMIHGDSINFHIYEETVTFFDLDDCTYHWFAFDIANGLYSLLFIIQNEGINFSFTFDECVEIFIKGYRTEKDIDDVWVDRIPSFVNYRTALLSQWLETPENAPQWVSEMSEQWREKLELWIDENLSSELNVV